MTFYQGLATTLIRAWAATLLIWGAYELIATGLIWLGDIRQLDGGWRGSVIMQLVSVALYIFTGAIVWRYSLPMGRRIGRGDFPAPEINLSAETLASIGSFLIGLFFFLKHAPAALGGAARTFYLTARETDSERLGGTAIVPDYDWLRLAGDWAALIIAILIALGARNIGWLFGRLRRAGLERADGTSDGR